MARSPSSVRPLPALLLLLAALPAPAQIRVSFADPAASTASASGTDGTTTVTVALAASGSDARLDGNANGVGVDSSLDDAAGGATAQRRVDGTLAIPESITLTLSGFAGTVQLASAELGSFRSGDTVTFASSSFDGASGYDAPPWSFDDATDTLTNRDSIASGIQTIVFGGSPLHLASGDTITFSTSTAVGGGVLLDALTFTGPLPPGSLLTRVVPAIPSTPIVANPGPVPDPESSLVAPGNAKGQSFSLAAETSLTGFVFEVDGVTTPGQFRLEVLPAMDHLPWLEAVFSDRGILPDGLAAGDLLEIELPVPLRLERGTYVAALSGLDAGFTLRLSSDARFPAGALVRRNGGTGNKWRLGATPGSDALFAVLGAQTAPAPPAAGPNLIFLLADDLGWTDIRTGGRGPNVLRGRDHGSRFYQTPNLARLASQGLSFTHCYVHQNCAPTRAAILSGQYPPRSGNGVYNVASLNRGQGTPPYLGPPQNEDVPAGHVTFAEVLRESGYVTAHLGKYHVGNHEGGATTMPENQGFDFNFGGKHNGSPGSYTASGERFHASVGPGLDAWAEDYTATYIDRILKGPPSDPLHRRAVGHPLFPHGASNQPDAKAGDAKHLTDGVGDAALAFLRDHRRGALAEHPFYMQVHFYAVHTPIQARSDLNAKYGGVPDSLNHRDDNYAGLVEGVDQVVGRLLDFLDDPDQDGDRSDSIAGETMVLFCSDNGGHVGPTDNDPLRHRKGSFWDGGLRVPLILRAPGLIPAGGQTDTLVHAVDFYPTLLEFAGADLPPGLNFDGFSFAAHALDPSGSPRDRAPLFYHFPGYLDQRARPVDVVIRRVDDVDYKLIYNYDLDYTGNPSNAEDTSEGLDPLTNPWQLFDLTHDLSETNDLLDGSYWNWLLYGPIASEMAAASRAWLTQPGPDWNPGRLTVRASGAIVPFHPGRIPEPDVAPGAMFRIRDVAIDQDRGEATITFTSSPGFLFDLEGSSTPSDPSSWKILAADLPGETGAMTRTVTDPDLPSDPRRFYRAVVHPR